MREPYRLQIDLTVPWWGPRWALLAALMALPARELQSESVTLNTYYPAPSGVYTQMITTDNTWLARNVGRVIVGSGTPQVKLAVNGNMAVGTYADGVAAPANGLIVSGQVGIGRSTVGGNARLHVQGYARFDNTGGSCAEANVTEGVICSGAFATFVPGLYIDGWWYENRGGQVLAEAGAGNVTTQVRALNPATSSEDWMTLKKDDRSTHVYCCPR